MQGQAFELSLEIWHEGLHTLLCKLRTGVALIDAGETVQLSIYLCDSLQYDQRAGLQASCRAEVPEPLCREIH